MLGHCTIVYLEAFLLVERTSLHITHLPTHSTRRDLGYPPILIYRLPASGESIRIEWKNEIR